MRSWLRLVTIATAMLAAAACGGRPATGTTPRVARSSNDAISMEEIQRGHWANAYDLVESLRPRWLRPRGPTTILGDQTVVQVHVDDTRLGGVEALRGIAVGDIASIRWVDPVSAAGQWGADHAEGAIVITTRPR